MRHRAGVMRTQTRTVVEVMAFGDTIQETGQDLMTSGDKEE